MHGDTHDKHDKHDKHDHDKHDKRDHVHDHDDDGRDGKLKQPVILITNYGLGHAPAELGLKLAQAWLGLVDADEKQPAAICLYGEGVRLACEGSPVLDELRSLAARGTRLVVCTTCLNFYGLMEQLRTGTAGSMKDIVDLQWAAKKVITL